MSIFIKSIPYPKGSVVTSRSNKPFNEFMEESIQAALGMGKRCNSPVGPNSFIFFGVYQRTYHNSSQLC